MVDGLIFVILARSACVHLRSPSRVDNKILIIIAITPFRIILTVICVFIWKLLENNEVRYFLAVMKEKKPKV